MTTKIGFINISAEVPREYHKRVQSKYKKFPKFWDKCSEMFAAMAGYLTSSEIEGLKKEFPLVVEFMEDIV